MMLAMRVAASIPGSFHKNNEQNLTTLDNIEQKWKKIGQKWTLLDKVLLISFSSELDLTVWFKADADTVSATWPLLIIGQTR